ncbi:MAG: mechanosensitive ion channel family protein [Candidatus Micrarchaeota archaeon]
MSFAITIPYVEILESLPGGKITGFLILFILATAIFQIILILIHKIAIFLVSKTKTTLDNRIMKTLEKYLPIIAMATSIFISIQAMYPDITVIENYTVLEIYLLTMLVVMGFMISSLADQILLWYGKEIRPRKREVRDKEIFPFVRSIVKITIIAVVILFILQRLGFDTTAILTGLGIGGLAVALALQDTLANFFAGIHILVDKPLKEDDYIKLDGGVEGTVMQIGWRTTRLMTISMNELVVPNSKLVNSIIENYSNPKGASGVYYTVGVDYKEDIDNVEKVIKEALTKVAKENPTLDGNTIWIRFDSFGDYSLNFKFGYLVNGYLNRWAILKQVNRELFYLFKKNKISIPFPVRVVYQQKEKSK